MTSRRRSLAPRDQQPSAFASVLMQLRDAVDALGVALVDPEGETVDYATTVTPFDIKIAAAEASVLLECLRSSAFPTWPETYEVTVRGSHRTLYAQALPLDYALVLLLPVRCFQVSERALSEAVRDLCHEAGMELPARLGAGAELWRFVEVREGRDRRPRAVWLEGGWQRVDVLGRFAAGVTRRETGYRARIDSGAEFTLVREPLGRWYADVLPTTGRG